MVSSHESSLHASSDHDDRFAEVDRVVRFWWVAAFLALMVTASLVRGLSA